MVEVVAVGAEEGQTCDAKGERGLGRGPRTGAGDEGLLRGARIAGPKERRAAPEIRRWAMERGGGWGGRPELVQPICEAHHSLGVMPSIAPVERGPKTAAKGSEGLGPCIWQD